MGSEAPDLKFPGLCTDCPLRELQGDVHQFGQGQCMVLQRTVERLRFDGKTRDFVFIQPREEAVPLTATSEEFVQECVRRQFNGDCIVFRTFVNRLPESKLQ
ncbi:MAG TPA: hypothetical protein VFI84_01295 [Candidatus Saccharimonadales bacterium]|nr:hypothetical protein [Candidatus Saccharimonadales bacterium]